MKASIETTKTTALLIEEHLPVADVQLAEHLIVDASPERTFAAVRDLDFLRIHTPLLDAAMWVRGLPERLKGDEPEIASMRLADGLDSGNAGLPGWLLLGETPGHEIALGAVGRFWQPAIEWRDVARDDFAAFAEPGWGKIACGFSVRPYGATRSLLTYDCRVAVTDDDARRRFGRYWRLIRPFVGHIFRATLVTIAADAETVDVRG